MTRADRWSLVILTAVPVIINIPWALAGHPVLDGDNLTQNYPLRVLVGQFIAHGRLPLWDSGIWSGVPLLAGWNAGAMFPGSWLFGLMPPVAAYEVNVVATGIACGVGFHLFMRRSKCSPLASFLGALTFSETGFMSGQAVHLGLIEGTALVPWLLLAVDGAFRTPRLRGGSGVWIALFGACGGLALLAGDPRAVSSDAITASIYLAGLGWRERHRLFAGLARLATAAVLAVAIGAVQWLPGLAYLHSSQRSASTLSLFGYYSLSWSNLPLLFVPYLIGGNGNFSMPVYQGPLNMPEVTYAVGILPLIALFALLPEYVAPLSSRLRRARSTTVRSSASRGLGVWYAMFLIGLVLSTGTSTPLGHLLVHVPLYGGQRDQNRNSAISDFALCALLALFVDRLDRSQILRGAAETALGEAKQTWRRLHCLFGAAPVVAAAGLATAMLVWQVPMERWLGVRPIQEDLALRMSPYYAAVVAIAIAGLVVLAWDRWPSKESRRRGAAVVVVADVLLFVVMASYQAVPLSVLQGTNAPLRALESRLPPGTRVAIDDPDQLALTQPPYLLDDLGVNDLVLLHGFDSVQGYGSAVPAAYEAATGTHEVENLLPAALLGPTYDDLDLGLLVVVPEQFGTVIGNGAPIPIPRGPPLGLGRSAADLQPGGVARAPYPPAGPWRLGVHPVTWQLPSPTEISRLTLAFDPSYGPLPTTVLDISVELADGRRLELRGQPHGTQMTVPIPLTRVRDGGGALGLSVTEPSSTGRYGVVGAAVVQAGASKSLLSLHQPPSGVVRYALNGLLQGLLTPPRWVYAGRLGPLVLYRNTQARGEAWLESPGARAPSAPSVRGSTRQLPLARWQAPVTVVDASKPALLVRSEQYSPGWSAEVQPIGARGLLGPPRLSPVRPVGLLQGVEIPAGRYDVTWNYHPGRVEIGLLLSCAGCLVCAGVTAASLEHRRRQRGRLRQLRESPQ